MQGVQESEERADVQPAAETCGRIQASAYLLELSLDWIVLRASENIHGLIGKSHVTLIDEPLGRFVHGQALHDLRNLFARLSATTGVGRAYGIRLTDEPDLVDVAFQLNDGHVLLELVPSARTFGEYLGSVAGLISGLSHSRGRDLLNAGARRMRALTGYDRVTLAFDGLCFESSRAPFAEPAALALPLAQIIADTRGQAIAVFPRNAGESSTGIALMRACGRAELERLEQEGVRAVVRVPFTCGDMSGEFRCDSRTPRVPSLELHAAAELFAQMFAMRIALDRATT